MVLATGQPSMLYALGGVARGGVTRGGATSGKVFVSINGTQRAFNRPTAAGILIDSLSASEKNGGSPNTARATVIGVDVARYEEVIITQGSINNLKREFGGVVLTATQKFLGTPATVARDLSLIDYSWLLNALVTGHFTGTATAIATALVTTYAPGFSTAKIQTGLATLDGGISFTNVKLRTALDRLAARAGAYWRSDYHKRIVFGTTDVTFETNPVQLTVGLPTLLMDDTFSVERDVSQRLTRVHHEGGGGSALAEVSPGATVIPISDAGAEWYGDAGGEAIIGESQQIVTYTGRIDGGGGGLVGPGATPSAPLTMSQAFGGSLPAGTYKGWFNFVTGAGQSLVSPVASVDVVGTVAPPALGLGLVAIGGSGLDPSSTYQYAYSWYWPTSGNYTLPSPINSVLTGPTTTNVVVTGLQNGPYGAAGKFLWRTDGNGSQLKLLTVLTTEDAFIDDRADASLGVNAPTVATAIFNAILYGNVAAGQSTVTARKIFRSVISGSSPLLLTTIADNVTNSFGPNSTADASLGAAAPVADTSNLTQQSGQVVAGSTSLPVAGGSFPASGYARVGNQVVFYGSLTAAGLASIPATGPGSLQAAVGYNTTVDVAPQLIGIPASGPGAIVNTIPVGVAVNLWVTVNNLVAQAAVSALLDPTDALGGAAGIIPDVLSDQRLSRTETIARATVHLDAFDDEQVTLTHKTLDVNAHAGGTQAAALVAPTSVTETLRIQEVDIQWFEADPPSFPFRTVRASSQRYSIEDLLRQAREAA
jgi:hypothetical protein